MESATLSLYSQRCGQRIVKVCIGIPPGKEGARLAENPPCQSSWREEKVWCTCIKLISAYSRLENFAVKIFSSTHGATKIKCVKN